MSQKPFTLLELKNHYHSANTEANASIERLVTEASNHLSNLTQKVQVLEKEKQELQEENDKLKNEIQHLKPNTEKVAPIKTKK